MEGEIMKRFSFFFVVLAVLSALAMTNAAWGQQASEPNSEGESVRAELVRARERMGEAAEEFRRLVNAAQIGRARNAMIGVGIEDAEDGVRVTGVSPGGPADESGVNVGDVFLALDGVSLGGDDVESPSRVLLNRMEEVEPGDVVQLTLRRDGGELEVEVVAVSEDRIVSARREDKFFGVRTQIGKKAEDKKANEAHSRLRQQGPTFWGRDVRGPARPLPRGGRWWGMELVELTPALGAYFDTEEGILVVRAPRNDALELIDGDVILEINGRVPTNTEHAMRIFNSFETGESLGLRIMRDGRQQTLEIEFRAPSRRR